MNRATLPMRNFAKRLMAHETGGGRSYDGKILLGFHVCEKLRLHLATFMGRTGFHTLLARALALATVEVPWLRVIRVKPDDSFDGLEALTAQIEPDELFEGGVVVLAQLLGLLVAFIGEVLTARLIREIWPKMLLDDLDFGVAKKTDKPKRK